LQKTIRKAFSTRRKNLKNALSGLFIPEEIIACGIEPTLRAENLGLDSFVNLASILSSRGS
jgi:16S rRNA (adenine1518-N6/adenine1519-N6)-dimethyltransferase